MRLVHGRSERRYADLTGHVVFQRGRGRRRRPSFVGTAIAAGLLLAVLVFVVPRPAGAATGWSATPPMNSARAGHASAVLADGRVLVAGGLTPATSAVLSSAEIYDPVAGRWSTT